MLIKTIRKTGKPVNIQDRDQYNNEWKRLFDKVEKLCKKGTNINGKPVMDMLRVQSKLRAIERALDKRYKLVVENELPTTAEQWKALMLQYGDSPLLLTLHSETKELVIVIDDQYEQYQ